MTLRLAVRIEGDATGLKQAAGEASAAVDRLGTAAEAAGRKVDGTLAGASGPTPAAGPGRAPNPAPAPGSGPAPPAPNGAAAQATISAFRPDQLRNLGLQANDAITMLASGSGVMQVLATQGGQVAQVLGEAKGGVAAGLKDLALRAAGFVGPAGAVAGGLGAIAAAAITLRSSWTGAQEDVELRIGGIGRATGATLEGINKTAAATAAAGKMSVATAREMMAEYASTGTVQSEMFGSLAEVAGRYARATGTDATEANAALTRAFADPVKGAEQLNAKLGTLTGATLEQIRRSSEMGDQLGAQRTLMAALETGLSHVTEKTSAWAAAWGAVARMASNAGEAVGRALAQRTQDRSPAALTARLAHNEGSGEEAYVQALRDAGFDEAAIRSLVPSYRHLSPRQVTGIRTDLRMELTAQRRRQEIEDERTLAVRAATASVAANDVTRRTFPDMAEVGQLRAEAEKLKEALKDATSLDDPAATQAALDLITAKIRAGGSAAFELGRNARDAFELSKLTGYSRELETINTRFRELIDNATQAGRTDLAASLTTARDAAIGALNNGVTNRAAEIARGGGSAYEIAQVYRGQHERRDNASLVGFLQSAGIKLDPKDLAWCAAFANAALIKAGLPGTGSNLASSFANYGRETTEPRPGDIVVMKPQARGASGHVGFFEGYDPNGRVRVFGGNQGDEAKTSTFGRDQVLSYRRVPTAQDAQGDVAMLAGWRRGTEELTAANDLKNASYGRSALEVEKARVAQQLENEAKRAGKEIDAELRREIDATAEARARSTASAQSTALQRAITHERRSLGLSANDNAAEARLRAYGVGESDPQREFLAGQIRINQALAETKDVAGSAMKGFLQDLRSGASLGQALQNQLDRVLDRLLNKGIDSILDSVFSVASGGSKGGSGGGLLASLFSSLSGSLSGKKDGGPITGPGGPRDDAVLLWGSAGEYVVNAAATARHRPLLEAINDGRLPAFRDGGEIRPLPTMRAGSPAGPLIPASAAPAAPVVNVYNSQSERVSTRAKAGPGGSVDLYVDALDQELAERAADGRSELARVGRGGPAYGYG